MERSPLYIDVHPRLSESHVHTLRGCLSARKFVLRARSKLRQRSVVYCRPADSSFSFPLGKRGVPLPLAIKQRTGTSASCGAVMIQDIGASKYNNKISLRRRSFRAKPEIRYSSRSFSLQKSCANRRLILRYQIGRSSPLAYKRGSARLSAMISDPSRGLNLAGNDAQGAPLLESCRNTSECNMNHQF